MLRQTRIKDLAAGNPILEMTAVQGLSFDRFQYSELVDLAYTALRYDIFSALCGEIEYELIYGEGADQSILSLDKEEEVLTLKPAA